MVLRTPTGRFPFAYGPVTLYGAGFPSRLPLGFASLCVGPLPPSLRKATGLGFSAFARHYSRNHFCFLFLRVLRCFSSPRFPRLRLFYSAQRARAFTPGGFPRSDIRGSQAMCASPRLFAACRVLLRLPVPRHPPCALYSLTLFFRSFIVSFKIPSSLLVVCFLVYCFLRFNKLRVTPSSFHFL